MRANKTLIRAASDSAGRAWLSPLLLALAMAFVFALNADRAHYYAPMSINTAKNLAIAENLSPEHNFRMFRRLYPTDDGTAAYEMYTRFPIGGFALIKLVILPFGDDIAAKIFAARMLMLTFLAAAAFLSYLAILRIASNKWIALTATLAAFSSYYVLGYSTHVSNEFMMDLFAVMLTFHGMVVFIQEGRFRQLVIKACIALLIGWHVYAFLVPFVLLGLAGEFAKAVKRHRESTSSVAWAMLSIPFSSRYVRLGAAALLFGVALLAFNFISEYDALNGETPFAELPSVQSMIGRLGLNQEFNPDDDRQWTDFLSRQFYRVVGASSPYALTNWPGSGLERPPNRPPLSLSIAGLFAVGVALAGLLFTRSNRILFATLALSGFFWNLPMRNNTSYFGHQFEAIYYIGIPLTIATIAMLALSRFGFRRLLPVIAIVFTLLFMLSSFQMAARGAEAERTAARMETLYSDLMNIRQTVRGENVLLTPRFSHDVLYGSENAMHFLLAGSRIRYFGEAEPEPYDYVLISHYRNEARSLLTPENEITFLYGDADLPSLHRSWRDSVASSGEPAVQSVYDLYLTDDALVYVKEPCVESDIASQFFLHVFPERAGDLPADRRENGYENLDFNFLLHGVSLDGLCIARAPLPDRPSAAARTGQFDERGELWSATVLLNTEALRAAYQAAASREPDAESTFNLYLNAADRTLIYVKEPCAASDADAPFFLHARPERTSDLPERRRAVGFDNLDFDFRLRGAVFDGKCAALVSLPEYPIADLRTGQWVPAKGETWSTTVQPPG